MKKENARTDDDFLWDALRAGDEEAFARLYHRYFRDLFHYGRQFLPDEAAVDDAIQDLFVDLWRTRRSLSQARSVKYYLMASLRRRIYRVRQSTPAVEADWEALPESLLPVHPSAETTFAQREEKLLQTEKLNAWLDQLPPRQREALVLRYYYDMEYAELAELLDIKEQTSRNLVQKALQKLRQLSILLIFTALKIIC